MSYISPKQRFIEEVLGAGCAVEDAIWLANLQFDECGDPKPGSIYETLRKPTS